jgi:putative selenium metabolism hydrolase
MMRAIHAAIQELSAQFHEPTVDFAARLVRTKSISCEEKAVADLYMNEMNKLGYDSVFRDDMGNVVGIIAFSGDGPAIMYNSHMDHVDAGAIDNWQGYDPYGGLIDECEVDNQDATARETARCIHGRAASDVKGGAAVAVYTGAVLLELKKQGFTLKGKFIFTGVVQEEPAECAGMRYLVDTTFPEQGLDYDAMVSSEATSLKLVLGSRGRVELLVTVHGRTSHGSTPWRGINAIDKAVPLVLAIQELARTLPADEDLGQATIAPTIISCTPGQLSIIPDQCRIALDRRLLPGETAETAIAQIQDLIDAIKERDPGFRAEVTVNSAVQTSYTGLTHELPKAMAAWKIAKDHPVVQACAEALQAVGQTVKYGYWDFGTDASKTAGIDRKPCIGYSPMQEQYAHTPYDKVRCDYIGKALEGNASIYIALSNRDKDTFKPI